MPAWRTRSRWSRGPSTSSSWPRTRGASSPHQVGQRPPAASTSSRTRSGSETGLLSSFPDTTVTVSIAAVPNYPPIKSEGPSHSFSVSIPNSCADTDGHVSVFDRQLAHNGVQFSPSTQSRTPPDSTFPESFKDGSQEVCVSSPPLRSLTTTPLSSSSPPLSSRLSWVSPIRQKGIHLIPRSQRWARPPQVFHEHAKIATGVLLCHCLTNTIKCCTFFYNSQTPPSLSLHLPWGEGGGLTKKRLTQQNTSTGGGGEGSDHEGRKDE